MMTPEPKYLAMKKSDSGIPSCRLRLANTGNTAPVVCQLDPALCMAKQVRTERGSNHDNEDGRDADPHASIVFVGSNAMAWGRFFFSAFFGLAQHEARNLQRC